jgi:PPOX class probable F420-dependent enzyme
MPAKPPTISTAIRAKLREARVARLATVDLRSGPHVVPVCFVLDGSVFYSAIDRKPKRVAPERLARLKNIRATPRVALLIDHYSEDWTQLWYILIRGKAKLLPRSARAERARAIRLLKAKYAQYAAGMVGEDALILRISMERIISWGKI